MEDFIKDSTALKIGVMLDDFAVKPKKAHEEDAGFDLCMPIDKFGMASPQRWMEVDTGVHMVIPKGYCGLLVSKSGLNIKILEGKVIIRFADENELNNIVNHLS